MKRVFGWLHLWLSLPFGVVIALTCFSGAMLVFENEIMRLVHRDMFYVKSAGKVPLPADILAEKVAASLPDGVRVTGITVFSDPERCYQVGVSKPRKASVFVNQYTGEVTGRYVRAPFFDTMFRLHRWLLDSRPSGDGVFWGKLVVGVSTLFFVVILISGVVVWWPRTVRCLRQRLVIRVTGGWRRFWYDLHVAGGVYVFVVLLVMALTGLTWSFSWYRDGVFRVFGAETEVSAGKAGNVNVEAGSPRGGDTPGGRNTVTGAADGFPAAAPFATAQRVLERLGMENPGFEQISGGEGTASVSFGGWGNSRAADRYLFDTVSGEITDTALYVDAERAGKLRGWIYSVHVGSWGGTATKVLAFAAALIGAFLPLTGYYLWFRRIARGKRPRRGCAC